MKHLIMATALILAAPSTLLWAQAPGANDPHHQSQTAAPPGPAQSTSPPSQPGMGGAPMMNMMSNMMNNMSMMNMMGMMRTMRMMGSGTAGMATIDRIEGRIAFLRAELKSPRLDECLERLRRCIALECEKAR